MPRVLSFRTAFLAIAALMFLTPAAALADTATLSNGQSLLEIGGSQVHLLSLPNGQSQKPNGQTTLPEPASMFLLGTGLVGVASRLRRRRRNQQAK